MQARISIGGMLTKPFGVSAGLRQGCILAPILFVLFFTFVLHHAFKDLPDFGVKIRHKQENKSTQIASIGELLYADDVACVDHNATNLQTVTTSLNEACLSWGLTISKPKTEVLHANCPDPPAR